MKIDDDKFPWNILGKLFAEMGKQQAELCDQGGREVEYLQGVARNVRQFMLTKHKCPYCGSSNLETYKDDKHVIIACEDCKKTIRSHEYKKIRPEPDRIKRQEQSPVKQALPILFWMIVFTVVFALFIRAFMMKLGIVI